ncbi:MAG: SpoIIE family protein phosphatase [bacterium]
MHPKKDRRIVFSRGVFIVSTLLAMILSGINLYQVWRSPTDECKWSEREKVVVITSVTKGGTSEKAGMQTGDILLKIAGENATTSSRAQAVLDRQKVGEPIQYFVLRDRNLIELSVEVVRRGFPPLYIVMSCVGFIFGIVGLWIAYMRPEDPKARVLFLLFLSFMLFWTLNYTPPLVSILQWIIIIVNIVTFTTVPSFFLTFFLMYPYRHPFLDKKPWAQIILFFPSIFFLLLFFLALIFKHPFQVNFFMGIGLWGLYFILAARRLHRQYKTTRNEHLRRQIRVLRWGIVSGLAPTFLFLAPSAFGVDFPQGRYGAFLMGLIPLVFAYAVVRHRLMDIEIIVKKSFVYALLTGSVVGFYFVVVQIVGRYLQNVGGLTSTFVFVLTTLFVAFAFSPVRSRLQRTVDKAFFRQAYDYRETLRQFTRTLNTLMEPRILMSTVLSNLCETICFQQGYFFLKEINGSHRYTSALGYPALSDQNIFSVEEDSVICQKMLADEMPVLLSDLPECDSDCRILVDNMHGTVAIPLFYQKDLTGFILIGEKRSEMHYSVEDLELLAALADQVAVALENGKLHQSLAEQERLKHELEIARQIQLKSLPQKEPILPGFDIYGCSFPATEVGGDYYDYLQMPEGKLGIVVGDVSGKGTSAALYMSKIQGFFRALAEFNDSPKQLLIRINSLAFGSVEEKAFVTLVVGIVAPEEKSITIARAGHTAVFVFEKKTNRSYAWSPTGIGLALNAGDVFDQNLAEEKKRLSAGDALLFYSDGLIEANNVEGEEFGEDRLKEIFTRHIASDAKTVGQSIFDAVRNFAGSQPQRDDMTLVVLKTK